MSTFAQTVSDETLREHLIYLLQRKARLEREIVEVESELNSRERSRDREDP